ncbi:ProQ/FINO family protein [Marinobacterium sp. YM272]|uniref:ProQ/FINO family protein n=1 Tax=Marinobacterium sp. YM272 TaxID=3421654 RepID=UPI003D7FC7C2
MGELERLRQETETLLSECERRLKALESADASDQSEKHESVSVNQTEKSPETTNRNRAKNRAANQAALQMLFDTYPEVFSRENVRPLKIGIQEDLIADEKLARNRIKRALASYVRNPHYLRSLKAGADRIGLDGAAAGTVTEDEAAHAQEKLNQMRDQRREKQKEEREKQKEERVKQKKQAAEVKEQRMNKKLDMLLQLNKR